MVKPKTLSRAFFNRSTLTVARSLIGKYLVRENGKGTVAGKVIEVEAYVGPEDKACHASKGRTARTEVLFGPPGMSYVYLIYGMYHMLNVVTERTEFPAAVLIRAIEVEGELIDGPGKLCRALEIDRSLNRLDMTHGRSLWFEDRGVRIPNKQVGTFPRIGVAYAGIWAKKPWRFRLCEDGRKMPLVGWAKEQAVRSGETLERFPPRHDGRG
ncbi:MAG: DNA-3-methyladenine glycosylase [Nitrospira sp.]|nr:DNA-3-methyladenine glycosylase [Nitrospira sp.]